MTQTQPMPRRNKPRELEVIEGRKHSPLKAAPQPDSDAIPISQEPPDWLTGFAAEEWRRVVQQLERKALLWVMDETLLAGYCQQYHLWRMAAEDIVQNGLTVEVWDPKSERAYTQPNPAVKCIGTLYRSMESAAKAFGITPNARTGLAIPKSTKSAKEKVMEGLGT